MYCKLLTWSPLAEVRQGEPRPRHLLALFLDLAQILLRNVVSPARTEKYFHMCWSSRIRTKKRIIHSAWEIPPHYFSETLTSNHHADLRDFFKLSNVKGFWHVLHVLTWAAATSCLWSAAAAPSGASTRSGCATGPSGPASYPRPPSSCPPPSGFADPTGIPSFSETYNFTYSLSLLIGNNQ